MKRISKASYRLTNLESPLTVDLVEQGFPSARYFQVHFEEIHLQLRQMQNTVDQLQKQLKDVRKELKIGSWFLYVSVVYRFWTLKN